MAINIQISYPTEKAASAKEIQILKQLEEVLKTNLVMITGKSYEKYEWKYDETVIRYDRKRNTHSKSYLNFPVFQQFSFGILKMADQKTLEIKRAKDWRRH